MLFAQMVGASLLREIEIDLKDSIVKIFHCGARVLSKSILSYADEHRDYWVCALVWYQIHSWVEVQPDKT